MSYEKLIGRLDQLIIRGDQVLLTKFDSQRIVWVDAPLFYQWKAGALSFLKTVFGEDSPHYQDFQSYCKIAQYYQAVAGQGILRAAREDIEGGYLVKLETLVAADVFTDFLDMAQHLLEQGYKDPAASLIGAVLEDGLRKIAANNKGIKLHHNEDINSLNQKLADKQVYNRLTQKRVKIWDDIRNNADHGRFSEYDLDLVKEMRQGVEGFLGQYLASKTV